MPERLDRVTVATPSGTVTLSWDGREQLLAELPDELEPVRQAFKNAGATRPVQIPDELKPALVELIMRWGNQHPGGLLALPEGVFELGSQLADEVKEDGPAATVEPSSIS